MPLCAGRWQAVDGRGDGTPVVVRVDPVHVRVGAPLSAFRHLSNLNLCLVVALVDAGASMADDVHADFLGDL